MAKYRKAITAALALLIANGWIAYTNGDLEAAEALTASLTTVLGTFAVWLFPNDYDA